jgi:hypothetical protein
MKFHKTRLQSMEEKKSLRQAAFFLVLTVILILGVFFLGIPLFIKLAVMFGNKSSTTPSGGLTQNVSLSQPRLVPLPTATNSASLSLSGFSIPEAKIKIFLNNVSLKEVKADKNGEFNTNSIMLKEGSNSLKIIANADNKDSEPYTTSITYSNSAPSLEITTPKDNASYFDKDKEISVEGKTDQNCIVTVNNHMAIVSEDGSFSIMITLNDGDNTLRIVSQNEAGNQTAKEIKVTYSQ